MRDADDLGADLRACAAGEKAALQRLYRAVSPLLFGLALRMLKDRGRAEDVLHETFLQVWQRADRFDPGRGPARAWIVGILRYRALDALRSGGREVTTAEPLPPEQAAEGPDAFELLRASRDAAALHRCLGELAVPTRHTILLAYTEGLSHSEIAARVDAPIGTVKSWIRRGLLALKDCLGP